jgi:general secretion pathway protein I
VTCRDGSREPVAGSRRAGCPQRCGRRFGTATLGNDARAESAAAGRRAGRALLSGYRLPATGYRLSSGYRLPPGGYRLARGFTLIELVAAFVIFALGFGILLQIVGSALHTTAQSAEYSRAAMWAQSLLDTQGIGEPLREGSASGQFDNRYSWQLNVSRYDPPPAQSTVATLTTPDANGLITAVAKPLDLFQLDLDVSWGSQYLTHHARFSTVRAMNPQIEAGNDIPPPALIRSRQ